MVNLGDVVIDRVSGFTGIVVAIHNYLDGCTRLTVQPKVGSDGKLPNTATFDAPQLVVHKTGEIKIGDTKTGGPEKYTPSERPV